ncbi:MAG: T9SS type A sorting domain-containing protein [Flavobacteriales bacterium]|nr:T9SS type A sorting domain-containing protein [Flavobacteriales bacterium]
MKTVLLFLIYFVSYSVGISQTLDWVKGVGGAGSDYCTSIVVNDLGDVYVTGNFGDTVDFDPGIGVANLISVGDEDVFIQKLDVAGNFLWAKSFGGIGSDEGRSLKLDDVGNLYLTGLFYDTVDFDPNIGVANHTSTGLSDSFIQKFDSNGNLIWVKTFGGVSGWDNPYDIAIDDIGNIYTIGIFNEIVDFDPNAGVYNMGTLGLSSAFIQKLDSSGNLLWAKSLTCIIGCLWGIEPHSIGVDDNNNIYINGGFSGTSDFDPGVGIFNLTSISMNSKNMYIQKLDSNGNFVWAKMVGSGIASPQESTLTIDKFANIYSTGPFYDTVDFDPSNGVANLMAPNGGIFIQKLDSGGNYIWAKGMTGASNYIAEGTSISVDGNCNVYTTGQFNKTIDFDPNVGVANLTTATTFSTEIFIQKLDSAGNYVWAKHMKGSSTAVATSISVNGLGSIYVAGAFRGLVNFEPDTGSTPLTAISSGDIFIQKLNYCTPNTELDIVSACKSYTWVNGVTYTSDNATATYPYTNINGCDSIVTLNLTIDSVDVSVIYSAPLITANATGVTYQWLDCDNNYAIINGEINQNFTVPSSGNYAVEITDNNCIDTSDCIAVSLIGITENRLLHQVSIFPNPAKNQFTLWNDLNCTNGEIKIIIHDAIGKVLIDEVVLSEQQTFNIHHLKSGIYFYTISQDNQIIKKDKLIIE